VGDRSFAALACRIVSRLPVRADGTLAASDACRCAADVGGGNGYVYGWEGAPAVRWNDQPGGDKWDDGNDRHDGHFNDRHDGHLNDRHDRHLNDRHDGHLNNRHCVSFK
jgi:hypothetical protein